MAYIVAGIIGPTATGKTAVSIELAKKTDGEIISADSMAVYRGMDIGTAKPTESEQNESIFHLIDIIDPNEKYSAAIFKEQADNIINDILSRKKLPIISGGTGLYIKTLIGEYNIPKFPPDYEYRNELIILSQRFGNNYLLDELRKIDSVSAAKLHQNDLKRIIRAMEIFKITGKPISYFHINEGTFDSPYVFKLFGLNYSREILYKRIEERIDNQIKSGLIDEVRTLLDKGYNRDLPSMNALGYKQIAAYLNGEIDLDSAIINFKKDTRRFAKRQFTWFRAMKDIDWIDAETFNNNDIISIIQKKILNEV